MHVSPHWTLGNVVRVKSEHPSTMVCTTAIHCPVHASFTIVLISPRSVFSNSRFLRRLSIKLPEADVLNIRGQQHTSNTCRVAAAAYEKARRPRQSRRRRLLLTYRRTRAAAYGSGAHRGRQHDFLLPCARVPTVACVSILSTYYVKRARRVRQEGEGGDGTIKESTTRKLGKYGGGASGRMDGRNGREDGKNKKKKKQNNRFRFVNSQVYWSVMRVRRVSRGTRPYSASYNNNDNNNILLFLTIIVIIIIIVLTRRPVRTSDGTYPNVSCSYNTRRWWW